MTRIVVLSDIHLSPTHGFFWDNWRIARDFANAARPDAILVNGDLAINGPDSDDEMKFAADALRGLRAPALALPGNHDVGDEPPGQDAHQIINEERLARWDRHVGRDRWAHTAGDWRLLGVNAQLFGSGLARETEQNRWLDDQLRIAADRPIALVLHKPLFLESADETGESSACLTPAARAQLMSRIKDANIRLVLSGHLHQHRDRMIDGVRYLWAPATAFSAGHELGGDQTCALMTLDFEGDNVDVRVERPAGLVSHDLRAIKGHGRYQFLRDMPASPPPSEGIRWPAEFASFSA
ncbi:metallophosphoesterase family protein [Terrarubrum flagellatum]|uniref:metallophosphoesterase family protein n=1 Tax=Terrirubrum flagellatum TaxID=2895980 RepID=UPI0031456659